MKYRIYSAALVACVMLSGCSSTESRPEVSASMEDLVSAGSTSVTTATGDVESQVPQAEKPDSTSGEATTSSVQVPTAEVTTTPDADSDFDIFYSEVHEQFDLSEEELSFVDYSLFVGDSICSGFAEYGIVPGSTLPRRETSARAASLITRSSSVGRRTRPTTRCWVPQSRGTFCFPWA